MFSFGSDDETFTYDDVYTALFAEMNLYDWQLPPMQSTFETYGSQITESINAAVVGETIGSVNISVPTYDSYEAQKVTIMQDAINENLHVFEEILEEKSMFDWMDEEDGEGEGDVDWFGVLGEIFSGWW